MVADEVVRLLTAAMAPNSHKTYAVGWRVFCQFRQEPLSGVLPASVDDVRRFIAWLSLRGLAPSTIATYVSAVGYFHKINSKPDPTKDFVVTKLLEGSRRDRPSEDNRAPITLPMLSNIVNALPAVCSSKFESLMFRAAFLSAFFGFMRVGEITVTSRHTQEFVLNVADVQFCSDDQQGASVHITLRHAKNNQTGPPQNILLMQSQDLSLCPVRALQDFSQVRPSRDGPFFCHFDGRPLTQYQFSAVLQKAVDFAGLTGRHIRSHSFRIGAASLASQLGVSNDEICQMGRWRSNAFRSYIRSVAYCKLPVTQVRNDAAPNIS